MRKSRASVMVYTVLVVASMTTIVSSSIDLAASVERTHRSRLERFVTVLNQRSLMDIAESAIKSSAPSIPGTYDLWLNDRDSRLHFSPLASTDPDRAVAVTLEQFYRGRSHSRSSKVGYAEGGNYASCGLAIQNSVSGTGSLVVNGDAFLPSTALLSATSRVTGDLYDAGERRHLSFPVSGERFWGSACPNFPFTSSTSVGTVDDYRNAGYTLPNIAFPPRPGRAYTVQVNGAATCNSTFSGKGLVIVLGNLTITRAMTSVLSSSQLTFLVTGDVTVEPGLIQADIFCAGTLRGSSASGSRQIMGQVWANSLQMGSHNWIFTPTNKYWLNPSERTFMQLPGY